MGIFGVVSPALSKRRLSLHTRTKAVFVTAFVVQLKSILVDAFPFVNTNLKNLYKKIFLFILVTWRLSGLIYLKYKAAGVTKHIA